MTPRCTGSDTVEVCFAYINSPRGWSWLGVTLFHEVMQGPSFPILSTAILWDLVIAATRLEE